MSDSPAVKNTNFDMAMDTLCVNSIRLLAADMVDRANSGHLGAAFGCAPLANALFGKVMKFAPSKPWANRDRFVLSAGHASALQYTMLHLCGYIPSMEEMKTFRQAGSILPGHPEFGMTNGIEATTGPLGQGFANGVGMAIAEAHMAARFNREGFPLFDYYTYVVAGDGCLMEGVTSEAASLAGHLQLHKLIVFYDDNETTIDGKTDIAFSEDVGSRFQAYGWNVLRIDNGDTCDATVYERAVQEAQSQKSKPTLVMMKTTIGSGAGPGIEGQPKAHGGKFANLSSLRQSWCCAENLSQSGDVDLSELVGRELDRLGLSRLDVLPAFHIPEAVMDKFRSRGMQGDSLAAEWEDMLQRYFSTFQSTEPDLVADLRQRMNGQYLTERWQGQCNEYLRQEHGTILPKLRTVLNGDNESSGRVCDTGLKYKAGRVYAAELLKRFVESNPAVIGGSPDVVTSCGGHWPALQGHFLPPSYATKYPGAGYAGRYIHFGIREHAGLAILNGISASAPLIPYATLFTVFYQYGLPAMRLACISNLPILYIGTHESIEVGEDGPTHQPVEILPQLRAMPNMLVIRPSNVDETAGAFQIFSQQFTAKAITSESTQENAQRPVFLMTTRGELGLPYQGNTGVSGIDGVHRGAYVLHDCSDDLCESTKNRQLDVPDVVLIASGQDVALVMKAKEVMLRWSKTFSPESTGSFFGIPIRSSAPKTLKVRIVSMPCWELFDEQEESYKESVLLTNHSNVLRIFVEKAATARTGHEKYAHHVVVMQTYGMSGKAADVEAKFGFTPENIAAKVWSAWVERERVLPRRTQDLALKSSSWMSLLGKFSTVVWNFALWSALRRSPLCQFQQKLMVN